MTNSITNRQMFFILILTLTTYTTIGLPKIVAEKAGRTGWILILGVALLFSGAAAIITKLNNRFQGKAMFDYSVEIVGKLASRGIAVYYLVYFVLVGIYLNDELIKFLTSNFLPKTPQTLLLAFSIILFAYVAFKGVTNVARLYEIIGPLFLVMTIVLCVIMMFQGMSYNIRPLLQSERCPIPPGAVSVSYVPFRGH